MSSKRDQPAASTRQGGEPAAGLIMAALRTSPHSPLTHLDRLARLFGSRAKAPRHGWLRGGCGRPRANSVAPAPGLHSWMLETATGPSCGARSPSHPRLPAGPLQQPPLHCVTSHAAACAVTSHAAGHRKLPSAAQHHAADPAAAGRRAVGQRRRCAPHPSAHAELMQATGLLLHRAL